jgi:hypothetical protein
LALGTAVSGPGGHFLRLINSSDLNKYKFNQKTRSIHVFTFRQTQNPDRLNTFDVVNLETDEMANLQREEPTDIPTIKKLKNLF